MNRKIGRFMEYCRKYTNLTAMQVELLKRVSVSFPFAADLAHAQLKLYVQTAAADQFLLLAQEQPHTVFIQGDAAPEGSLISCQEEPLIAYTFKNGKPVSGKREWNWGTSLDMYTFPIHDNAKVIAVVSLESDTETTGMDGYAQLLKTARLIMINARKDIEEDMYRSMSSSDGIIITDKYNRIIFANIAAVRIYKVLGVANLIGCHLFDRQLTVHIRKETVVVDRPYEKEIEAGSMILVQRNVPITAGGSLLCRVFVVADVTELRKKDKEILIKSAVIQEIHHRVKNNLQTIASLLRLQARRSRAPEVKAALQESVNRILSISVVHEFLSQQDGEHIDVVEVTKNILQLVTQNMVDEDFSLTTRFSGGGLILPSRQASNLALIVNELVLNSLEHGFSGRDTGLIGLDIHRDAAGCMLDLFDDGIGLPADFDIKKTKSLGLQIVRTLVEDDMGGTFCMQNAGGTHAVIKLPFQEEM